MKRSEVLGKIYDILYTKTDLREDLMEDLSNEILDTLEHKAGMKPPFVINFYIANGYRDGYDWEKENG